MKIPVLETDSTELFHSPVPCTRVTSGDVL